MKIAIYGKRFDKSFNKSIIELFEVLNKNKVEIAVYRPLYEFLINKTQQSPDINSFFTNHSDFQTDVDFILSLGGDGVILETVSSFL